MFNRKLRAKRNGVRSVFWNDRLNKYSVNLPIQGSKRGWKKLHHFDSLREAKSAFLASLPQKANNTIYFNREELQNGKS